MRRITIVIAGRSYPLNVPISEEQVLRTVGKKIELMIKDFEANFNVKDKQDALAMCALKLGTSAELECLEKELNITSFNQRLLEINQKIED